VLSVFSDAQAMERAFALARQGLGLTAPNPIVGAVILGPLHELISEGFHTGGNHAEVVAIKASTHIPPGSTIFVSLEPCAHFGKTPPCVDAIIEAGISRVVFSVKDPNPIAAGGLAKLLAAGVEVTAEYLSDQGKFINRDWLTKIRLGRPRFVWKTAITLDGKIAATDGTSKWITSEESRNKVGHLRDQSDAILVGTGTALADNPHLVPADSQRKMNPVRVVLGNRDIPTDFHLHDERAETIFLKGQAFDSLIVIAKERGWNRILVESGSALASALVIANLVDEIHAFIAPTLLGTGKSFIGDLGISTLAERMDFEISSLTSSGTDIEVIMQNKKVSQ
jgi:diaminohydroxyphosphoribosylaminopyrimidine deaminase/5-amino-6-(5-phosphoribosylamino)uracil reductase